MSKEIAKKEKEAAKKRAEAAKKAADTAVANAKKAAAAKDINIAVVSSPIQVRIEATPFQMSTPTDVELKPEGKVSIPVKLDKKHGFDEAVDVTVALPKGVGGITVGKLQIAKGKTDGMLELTANAKPTPGDHVLKLTAKGAFNKVAVQATADVTVKVPKTDG